MAFARWWTCATVALGMAVAVAPTVAYGQSVFFSDTFSYPNTSNFSGTNGWRSGWEAPPPCTSYTDSATCTNNMWCTWSGSCALSSSFVDRRRKCGGSSDQCSITGQTTCSTLSGSTACGSSSFCFWNTAPNPDRCDPVAGGNACSLKTTSATCTAIPGCRWASGACTAYLGTSYTGSPSSTGDNWSIVNGKLLPNSDYSGGQLYQRGREGDDNKADCAIGYTSWTGAPGYSAATSSGAEPEDNWLVKWNDASLYDPDFQETFTFDNGDDDSIGVIFRMPVNTVVTPDLPDAENYYMFMWAWYDTLSSSNKGKHLWDSTSYGLHPAAVCQSTTPPPSSLPVSCGITGTFSNRIVDIANGHGGWLYRVNNGVITQIANTSTSFLQNQTYNVRVTGVNKPSVDADGNGRVDGCPNPQLGTTAATPASCAAAGGCVHVTIWMDRNNDGFQDADKVMDLCDNSANAHTAAGAYGLYMYNNQDFTVDGYVGELAPAAPTVNDAQVAGSADNLNAFLSVVAGNAGTCSITNPSACAASRDANWTVEVRQPGAGNTCNVANTLLWSATSPLAAARTLTTSFGGFSPGGSYCWNLLASNSLGSSRSSSRLVTFAPQLIASQPAVVSSGATSATYSFTSSDANGSVSASGTVQFQAGDCGGGGYALTTAATPTYAQTYDRPSLRLGTNQTVEAWVHRTGGAANTWARVAGKGPDTGNATNYGLWVKADGTVLYRIGDGTALCDAQSATNLVPTGSWVHIAGRYTGSAVQVLVNGVQRATLNCTRTPSVGTSPFLVGYGGSSSNQGFVGHIAHVSVHNTALSDATLAAHYALGAVADPPVIASTVLSWNFREHSSVQAVWDASTFNNSGFLGSLESSDGADPVRGPTPSTSSSATGTTTFTGSLTGLSLATTYCVRGTIVPTSGSDPRRAVSGLRIFTQVSDNAAPVVTPPATATFACNGTSGASGSTLSPATAVDNYDPAPQITAFVGSTSGPQISGPPFTYTFPFTAPGPTSTTVVWRAADASGNTGTGNQSVVVTDTTAPTLAVGAMRVVEATNPSPTNTSYSITGVTGSDACDASVTLSNNAPATYPLGDTTVTFTGRDDTNNVGSANLVVRVVDTTRPVYSANTSGTQCPATLPQINMAIAGSCVSGGLSTPVVTDNGYAASALTMTLNGQPAASASVTFCPGVNQTVTWVASDPSGNSCSATQLVAPYDATPTINDAQVSTTIDQRNAFVRFVAGNPGTCGGTPSTCGATRNATWSVEVRQRDGSGNCAVSNALLWSTTQPGPASQNLDITLPGFTPGSAYCYNLLATNGSASDTSNALALVMLPPLVVSQPAVTTVNTTTENYAFTTSDVSGSVTSTASVEYEAGDCGGGGYALQIAAGTYAQAPDRTSLRLGMTQTVEAWVYRTGGAANSWSRIVGKGSDASLSTNYGLWVRADGTALFRVADGAANCDATTATGLVPLNTWTHLAGRYTGTTLSVLVGGTTRVTLACTRTPATGSSPLLVGWDGSANPAFTGRIAHVSIANAALSDAVIGAHAALGPITDPTALASTVLAWNFREATAVQAIWDSSQGGNNGYRGSSLAADAADPSRAPAPGSTHSPTGTTSFTGTLTGLTPGTTYCVRAVAGASSDTRLGASPLTVYTQTSDVTPPTVTPGPTVGLECGGSSGATTTLSAASVSDNLDPTPLLRAYLGSVSGPQIGGPPFTYTFPMASPGPVSSVVWQATDASGNSSTANQTVWVGDSTPPSIGVGSTRVVEATNPAPVGTAYNFSPAITVSDACDPAVPMSSDAPGAYPLGQTTVHFSASDDSGNTANAQVIVNVVDTTPPTFTDALAAGCPTTLPPLTIGVPAICFQGAPPSPAATDNGYAATNLSYALDGQPLASASDLYCDGVNVTATWTVTDPDGNSCDAVQDIQPVLSNVEINFAGFTLDGNPVNADLGLADRYFSDNVAAVFDLVNCAEPRTFTIAPTPASEADTGAGNQLVVTYAAEGLYPSVTVQASCNAGSEIGIGSAVIGAVPATFGIDRTPPFSDFSEILSAGVVPGDSSTYPRLFLGETVALDLFEAADTQSLIQSGIKTVTVEVRSGAVTPASELTLGTISASPISSPVPMAGPAAVGVGAASGLTFVCDGGASSACQSGSAVLSAAGLAAWDSGARDPHALVISVEDQAGNVAIETFYFYLRDWSDALAEAALTADALAVDPFNAVALTEIEDAQDNVHLAEAYDGLSFAYTDGSYLRAHYGIDSYEAAESYGLVLEPQREYLARAGWGDVRVYVDNLAPTFPADQALLDDADDLLDGALVHRQNQDWGSLMEMARRARDAVVLLDPGFQAVRLRQDEARQELATFDPANNTWNGMNMPHISDTGQMITAARAMLLNQTSQEIAAALSVPETTQTEPLQAIVTAITPVAACLNNLASFQLNDQQYTTCYLAIDDMARTLDTVQISLVSTYRWQASMALALFAMLSVSLELSPTGLPWVIADVGAGNTPAWVSQDDWGDYAGATPVAQAAVDAAALAWEQYQQAIAQLQAGDILGAYATFSANRCLIRALYSYYYSVFSVHPNVSSPFEDVLPADPLCPL